MASYPVTFYAFSLCVSIVCMHDRLQRAILLNNVIKTILSRSIGLFGFFLMDSGHCSDVHSFFNLIS